MSHNSSAYFHIVFSPLIPVDWTKIESFLKSRKAVNYIISEEHGSLGHQHYDCFVEFPEPIRSDNLRKSARKVFSDIPPIQFKHNCKFIMPKIDKNPLYGIGYSAKEHNIKVTTYPDDVITKALEYFVSHEIKQVKPDVEDIQISRNKMLSFDQVGNLFVKFSVEFYKNRTYVKNTAPYFLVSSFLDLHSENISLSVYSKCKSDLLGEFAMHHLNQLYCSEDRTLDCPPNTTPSIDFSSITEKSDLM